MAPPASFALRNPQRQQIIDASKELGSINWRMVLDGNVIGTTPSLSEAYDLLNAALDEVTA
jgi:hypothetical protein